MINVSIGIISKNNKILMIKRAKKEGDLLWAFPGGKVEENETKEQACIREVKEETNLNVSIIKTLGERKHPNTDIKITYFLCKVESGETKILNNEEILDIAFKTRKEFTNDVKTDVFEPVKKYINNNIK